MAETTHISWCDHTHNHWVGCMKVSTGPKGACELCYAENLVDHRFGWAEFGGPGKGVGTRKLTSEANRRKPLAWDRAAAKAGTRPFVFCCSLADVFDNQVPSEWRRDLFDLIRATPHLTWLLLTKRPQNIVKLFNQTLMPGGQEPRFPASNEVLTVWWPRNAAIGCTVVTQAEADRDIPILLAAKAALRPAFAFVSMEPLMGAVNIQRWLLIDWQCSSCRGYFVGRHQPSCPQCGQLGGWTGSHAFNGQGMPPRPGFPHQRGRGLDWVITGGETDQGKHRARPSHPGWFRGLRDQCAAAGIAYHHKQNGEFTDFDHLGGAWNDLPNRTRCDQQFVEGKAMIKVGKKAAGRLLDGVEHNARPGLPELAA